MWYINFSGVPVKEDVGPVDKVVPGDKSSNTRNLIIGISVAAGILFLVILVICCARKCAHKWNCNPPHQGYTDHQYRTFKKLYSNIDVSGQAHLSR